MSSSTFTLRERLRYAFDNTLSKGTIALIGWLAIISTATIMVFGAILAVTGLNTDEGTAPVEGMSFIEGSWQTLMRTFDAGNMAGDAGWPFRLLMLAVTLFGIFVLSTLIGVLSAGLEAQIEKLRKGRGRVVETDHTVILGWSEQIFPIITELIEANASRKHAAIVILGDKDKVEMEDVIRDKVENFKTTTVICRTGSPVEPNDLRIVSIDTARSIIVVAPDGDDGRSDDPDADVIKALLAVTNGPDRKAEKYHLIAEIRDPQNIEVAEMVGKDEVELVLVGDLIARIMAQTCRQSGLSVVYTELLDFGGKEIYFKNERNLTGRSFRDCLLAHEDAAVIGIRPARGAPLLNPPMDTLLQADDRLIVIADDDDAIILSSSVANPDAAAMHRQPAAISTPERTLVLGWNWRGAQVINELDNYVPVGSQVHVVASTDDAQGHIADRCSDLKRMVLTFHLADTTDRRVLDALDVTTYDHIIVLCYSDHLDVAKADAKTLITLLHLRDMAQKKGVDLNIVSEMLDVVNRRLAEVTRADDFIVSDRLVSLMLSQISENKELNLVFKSLFSPTGSEIYLRPVEQYVRVGVPLTFATVIAAAAGADKSECAFGYKILSLAGDASQSYGVFVSPKKSDLITFQHGDKLIVLAED